MADPSSLPLRGQFNLRWLFAALTASALCALVFRLTGPVETIGVSIALFLYCLCCAGQNAQPRWLVQRLLVTTASAVLWMVAVDFSWFREDCEDCRSHWDVTEVRILRQPVWSWRGEDHCPTFRLAAEDLGAPCQHRFARWQKWRLWGFVYGSPFFNGTCCFSGDEWYRGEYRDCVRTMGKKDPKLGEEYRAALLADNSMYLRKFFASIRQRVDNPETR
jgi:hypothetical protein